MAIDSDKLNEFLGKFVGDLGATMAAGSVVIGHNLGLYKALASRARHRRGAGRGDPDQPALRRRMAARPGRERLRPVRPGRPDLLDDRGAGLRADQPGRRPSTRPARSCWRSGSLKAVPRITEAFRTGAGMGWHEQDADVFTGCEQFFRPGYIANLVPSWIPALDGVEDKLQAGATVADIGCGLGASTILLAQEYPNSRFTGSDYHDESIEMARKHAGDQGVADRVSFEVASASTFSGTGYDLAATFDCLHDMGDPLAAARHVRQALKPDGTWLIVEPAAADDVAGNLNPVGRVYYSASTLLCVPNALSQSGGYALGAQAGEAAIRQVITDAGFTRFRRAAETPFNIVYEVRP